MTPRISRRAYNVIFGTISAFLILTAGVWVILLSWMALNGIEGGDALNKLEIFVAGNFGLFIGSLLNPSKS